MFDIELGTKNLISSIQKSTKVIIKSSICFPKTLPVWDLAGKKCKELTTVTIFHCFQSICVSTY